ncbi:MAG TPA: carboxylesterase family protein [Gemmatirosa sp.]
MKASVPLVPLLATALLGATARAQSALDVLVDGGRVRGAATDGVVSFKGIPFAAPPLGALRWRPPQRVPRWSGVRAATAYGHDCMQQPFPSDAAPLGTPPAEDCLYLNVWRPAGRSAGDAATRTPAKLPVLVWIYGGGFVNGGASPPTYAGAELAKNGIMFVSFNYRVGRFGFFVHPQLTRETPSGEALGNYGFMDQVAALEWVRRNIAAFGGDPANVTVVGESAGGASVHMLLTSPRARGLVQKAVIQSGADGRMMLSDVASAEKAGLAFAAANGIAADDPNALAKLRALSAEQVTDGLNMMALFERRAGPATFTTPIVDGRLAVDVIAAYEANRFTRVPVMVGATSADMGGPEGPMIRGAGRVADLLSSRGVPVYYYRFSYVADSARAQFKDGAPHASDIPFFFRTVDAKYGAALTARDRQAAGTASGYLVNFVKRGDPNGAGLPAWPSYSRARPMLLDLDASGGAAPTPVR